MGQVLQVFQLDTVALRLGRAVSARASSHVEHVQRVQRNVVRSRGLFFFLRFDCFDFAVGPGLFPVFADKVRVFLVRSTGFRSSSSRYCGSLAYRFLSSTRVSAGAAEFLASRLSRLVSASLVGLSWVFGPGAILSIRHVAPHGKKVLAGSSKWADWAAWEARSGTVSGGGPS